MGRFRENPGAFLAVQSGTQDHETSQAPVLPIYENNKEKQKPFFAARAVEALLLDMEEILANDTRVLSETKNDVLSDLATLRIQLSRNVKNKAVIGALLANLSHIPSITPLVTGLNCIVDAYFD
jgi:hypothetical protein